MIIDGHHHIAGDPDSILLRMDALGIDRTVLVGVGVRDLGVVTVRDSLVFRVPLLLRTLGVWKSRRLVNSRRLRETLMPEPDNDRVAAVIRAHPGRFHGFAFINPAAPGMLEAAERRLSAGFCGIKLALLQYPAPLDGAAVSSLCELAQAKGCPVFFHQGLTPATADPATLIRRFPGVRFIMAHAGVQYFEAAVELARTCRNVWLDTSSYFVTPAKLRRLVRDPGCHKLIFGSDVPVMALDPAEALEKIIGLRLPAPQQAAILGGNLREILDSVRT